MLNSVYRAYYGLYLRLGNLIRNRKNKYGKQPEKSVAPDLPLIYVKVTVVAMGRVLILIQAAALRAADTGTRRNNRTDRKTQK